MRNFIICLLLLFFGITGVALATRYETNDSQTESTVLYGKTDAGVITAIKVDTDGGVYIGGTPSFTDVYVSGNVGIGSASPRSALDVDGTVYADSYISTNLNERWTGTQYTTNYIDFNDSSSGIVLSPNIVVGSNTLTTLSTGNVGIGTSVPVAPLDISASYANDTFPLIRISNTSTSGRQSGISFYTNVTSYEGLHADIFNDFSGTKYGSGGEGFNFRTGRNGYSNYFFRKFDNSLSFFIGNAGNVGIGTTYRSTLQPTQKLEVDGNIYAKGAASKYITQSLDGTIYSCGVSNTGIWSCSL